MYSNPAFQSPFFFFFLINCACTISHVPWIVRNPSTREGREGLLYLTLRSSCNSHFPSQCTIACEMGNCISELRARYNSVCSKRWPNSFMFTKTWPQPSPQLASRSLNGGDTLSHTSKEQDLFKGRVSQPVCPYHWHWVMSGETNLYRAVCVFSRRRQSLSNRWLLLTALLLESMFRHRCNSTRTLPMACHTSGWGGRVKAVGIHRLAANG